MKINYPRSAKIKVAVVHFDFRIKDLSAIDDIFYKLKIRKIEKALASETKKPDLIIFPEGSCSPYLIKKAKFWAAKWSSSTICGTRLDPKTHTVKASIITPNGNAEFEKRDLSPYDIHYSSIIPKRGLTAGGNFEVQINDQDSMPYVVKISVLICYDLRNSQYWPKSAFGSDVTENNACHLLVVPMFDKKIIEPRKIAKTLASPGRSIRTLLVNKAFFNVQLAKNRLKPRLHKMANLLSFVPFTFLRKILIYFSPRIRNVITLISSGHGPLNTRDEKFLKEQLGLESNFKQKMIWEKSSEGVLMGDYEVGVPFTEDHRDDSNAGFNYSGFSWMNI